MKKIIVLLMAVVFANFSFSQKLFKENSLNKAIKICKEVSKKDIINALDSNSPKELDSVQYALVEESVRQKFGNLFAEILEDYKTFSKKNSERTHKKTFKINLKDGPIKNEIAKELSEYRKWMRENGGDNYEEELDEGYIQSTTEAILARHYLPTLCEGVEEYTNNWLEETEEDYIVFLRTKTVHTKINDKKMMERVSSEYLNENKEDIIKFLLYLAETHDIRKHYGAGDINIEIKNKYNLKYLETIKSLYHHVLSSGKTRLSRGDKTGMFEILYFNIRFSIFKDIKYQIKISSEFK